MPLRLFTRRTDQEQPMSEDAIRFAAWQDALECAREAHEEWKRNPSELNYARAVGGAFVAERCARLYAMGERRAA